VFVIVREPLDAAALAEALKTDGCGAIVTFAGVVRDRSDDGRLVTGLAYEAYDALAVAEFETIAAEARARFGPCEMTIAHRAGDVRIGEAAVVVVVAAPHRGAAFDACEYAIDELKARAPIWKHERYADGDSTWKENTVRTESRS
jgi:molybdopterin synthase catalytic subunit